MTTSKIFTFEGWDTARLLSEWTPLFETDPPVCHRG